MPQTRKSRSKVQPASSAAADLSAEWVATIRAIPGYDPFRGADGCWFDTAAAQLAIDFFAEMLCHIEGGEAGKPFALEPWQKAIVANLFGWKRRDAKGRTVRRYREIFVYVPRKNGKTPLCAGIGLLVFFCDNEVGQQGFIAAKDREQAGLLFRQMEGMVERNPELARRCRIYGGNAPAGQSRSFVKPDRSFLKIISGDGGGKHGGNPHIVIVDELHEQESRELIDTLQTSMVSENRSQSLMISLTTADYDRPSICNEKYDYAKRVRDNPEKDTAFLPVIFEADVKDDPFAPETWRKANPNLGVSVSEVELSRLANKAKDEPGFKIEFLRLHLNVRVQKVVDRAIDLVTWDACANPITPPLASLPCWMGLDLGWRDDFAALARVWGQGEDRVWVDWRFWIPQQTKRDLRVMPFAGFVAGGYLTVTPGDTTDFAAIRRVMDETRDGSDLRALWMDPSYARSEATELMDAGFPVTEFRQNLSTYSVPWKWLAADGLKGRKLSHGGNPVARWMAGHVSIEVSGTDGVMPKKRKSSEKIDGITALCMALAAWLTDPDKSGRPGPSISWI